MEESKSKGWNVEACGGYKGKGWKVEGYKIKVCKGKEWRCVMVER